MKYLLKAYFGVVLLFASSAAMSAVWVEVPDAPDGPLPTAQDTVGAGSLDNIIGMTDTSVGDFRDSYAIVITDPSSFYATTSSAFGLGTGTADFDTRLFLWNPDGTPVMANDDHPGGAPFHSLIADPAIYAGTGELVDAGIPALVAGATYLLSITGFNDNALDAGGGDIFALGADFDALHSGTGTFASWAPGGATGNYVIELGGATFARLAAPEPAVLALLGLGLVAMGLARRRKS